jgi:hypothetical protein
MVLYIVSQWTAMSMERSSCIHIKTTFCNTSVVTVCYTHTTFIHSQYSKLKKQQTLQRENSINVQQPTISLSNKV